MGGDPDHPWKQDRLKLDRVLWIERQQFIYSSG